jgi:hypothetical protein
MLRLTTLAMAALALAAPARADYPYSGYFGASDKILPARDIPLMCAVKFFIQHENGDAEDFFLDVKTFKETGKLIYLRSNATKCAYAADRKTEDCTTTQSASDKSETFPMFNYLQKVTPDFLETVFFRDEAEYKMFMADPKRIYVPALYPTTSFIYYYRCPNHSPNALATYVRDVNTVDYEETDAMLSPTLDGIDNLRPVAEKAAQLLSPAY